jgi:hypothetical protein
VQGQLKASVQWWRIGELMHRPKSMHCTSRVQGRGSGQESTDSRHHLHLHARGAYTGRNTDLMQVSIMLRVGPACPPVRLCTGCSSRHSSPCARGFTARRHFCATDSLANGRLHGGGCQARLHRPPALSTWCRSPRRCWVTCHGHRAWYASVPLVQRHRHLRAVGRTSDKPGVEVWLRWAASPLQGTTGVYVQAGEICYLCQQAHQKKLQAHRHRGIRTTREVHAEVQETKQAASSGSPFPHDILLASPP